MKFIRLLGYIPVYEYAYRSLLHSQWWSREGIELLQKKKLKRLTEYAYWRVPYYRDAFDAEGISPGDITSAGDLAGLPVLTKGLVNRNFKRLISRGFPAINLFPYSTGGSTGEPTSFLHDGWEMCWTEAAVHRSYRWAGYKRGDRFLLVAGLPEEKTSLISLLRRLQGQRRISLFGVGDKEVREAVEYLGRLNPRGVKGYASWLDLIGREMEKHHISPGCRPAYLISSSEKLYPEVRFRLERAFGVPPFDNYSSREFMIAAECDEHKGLHIAAENVIVEVVKKGKPVPPGEWGEILITDLNRFGMPLIRYALGDVGVVSERRCPCGRGLPLLEEVTGRVSDIIKTSDGKYIAAPAIAHIFKDLKVEKYRIIQEEEERLIVKVVKGKGYSERDEQLINQAFGNICIQIEYVDDIETIASGKKVTVQSKVTTL